MVGCILAELRRAKRVKEMIYFYAQSVTRWVNSKSGNSRDWLGSAMW